MVIFEELEPLSVPGYEHVFFQKIVKTRKFYLQETARGIPTAAY